VLRAVRKTSKQIADASGSCDVQVHVHVHVQVQVQIVQVQVGQVWCNCRCRRRTEKLLDSSPLQIALCVLVVLDAAIVLSEILIDLHAMRSQFSHFS